MLCTACHMQVFDHMKMWWLHQFVRTKSVSLSEEALAGFLGNLTNLWKFCVLLHRIEGLIRNNQGTAGRT